MQKLNQKGFTIIELLVVIVIIGILVALTLPNLFSAQARGRDTDRKNELKNIQQKLETYYNDNDGYPSDLGPLDLTTEESTDPRGVSYTYAPGDDGDDYELSIALENQDDRDAENGVYRIRSINQ